MNAINRSSIRQGKARYAFAGSDASPAQRLSVQANRERRAGIAFDFVVEINHASIEGHDVTDFVDQHRQRVFDFQRRTEFPRDFIQSVDLAMGVADLIVGAGRGVFPGAGYFVFRRSNLAARRVDVGLFVETARGNLGLELRQVLDKLIDNVRIKVSVGALAQQFDRFRSRHAGTERTLFAHRVETIDHRHDARGDGNLFAASDRRDIRGRPSVHDGA